MQCVSFSHSPIGGSYVSIPHTSSCVFDKTPSSDSQCRRCSPVDHNLNPNGIIFHNLKKKEISLSSTPFFILKLLFFFCTFLDIFTESAFYTKIQLCQLSFIRHLVDLCSHYRHSGMTVTVKGYFQQILCTQKNLGTNDQEKVAKSSKNNPAWKPSQLSFHKKLNRFPGCHFKDNGHHYLWINRGLSKKHPVVVLNEVEVQIDFQVCFLSAGSP